MTSGGEQLLDDVGASPFDPGDLAQQAARPAQAVETPFAFLDHGGNTFERGGLRFGRDVAASIKSGQRSYERKARLLRRTRQRLERRALRMRTAAQSAVQLIHERLDFLHRAVTVEE